MPRRPGYSGDLGQPSGFEDYTGDWEGFANEGWPGVADMNPWDVPASIPDDWQGGGWSMNFRPENIEGAYETYQDWAGQDALPQDQFNDAQYAQAFGGLPDAPGPGADPAALQAAGYGLDFNPGQTAQQDWRLQYGITDPGGAPTGYALSAAAPHAGFPWNPGYTGPDMTRDVSGGDTDTNNVVIDDTLGITDPRVGPQDETQEAQLLSLLSGLLPGKGAQANIESAMPLQPVDYSDLTRKTWGQDPLSQAQLSQLGHIMTSGGLTDTNLQRRTDQALQQIIAQGGQGAENLSPLGETTANTVEDLLASGGQLPEDVQRRAMEMETLRDPIEAFRQAQLAQGQATMADRGLLGQGPELDYMQRLETQMAPMYAQAGQQLALGEAERADQRYRDALQLGGELGEGQAERREGRLSDTLALANMENQARVRASIDANRAATEYREFLTDAAFQDLDRSIEWNKFLFDAGLQRAEALEMIETGRLQSLLAMINAYMSGAAGLSGGFIGKPFGELDE